MTAHIQPTRQLGNPSLAQSQHIHCGTWTLLFNSFRKSALGIGWLKR